MSQSQFTKWQDFHKPATAQRAVHVDELRQRVHSKVIEVLGPLLEERRMSERDLRRVVADTIHSALTEEAVVLSGTERAELVREITDDSLGYGPIDRSTRDPPTTEVMRNGPPNVSRARAAGLERTNTRSPEEPHLRRIIE